MLLRYATVPYPSIEQLKYPNCTVNLSKYVTGFAKTRHLRTQWQRMFFTTNQ